VKHKRKRGTKGRGVVDGIFGIKGSKQQRVSENMYGFSHVFKTTYFMLPSEFCWKTFGQI